MASTRRTRGALGAALVGIGTLAVAVSLQAAPGTHAPARASDGLPPVGPNVLVVVTDDQHVSLMAAMPKTRAWLGRAGAHFPNAIAQTPLCCPARASVLSGKYVHNHGVKTLDDARRLDFGETVSTRLHEHGYLTAISGKLMNSWANAEAPPGFDRYALLDGGYTNVPVYPDPVTAQTLGRPGTRVANQVAAIGKAGRTWLQQFEADDARPWMMYLAPTAPHTPYGVQVGTAPAMPDSAPLDELDLSDKPPHVRDPSHPLYAPTNLNAAWRSAYRTLPPVDDMLASLRQKLAELGELQNTLVVFTSDNGYLFGEHQRLGKREAYDGSLRVPMYVAWPAGAPELAGTVDRRIAALIDVAPTIFDATELAPEYDLDGQSVLGAATRRRILIEHFPGGSHAQAMARWTGWWSPTGMYRRNHYVDEGNRGCRDDSPGTLCYRYAGLPGAAELYDTRSRMASLLQDGMVADDHRRWAELASTCVGAECWELEARAPVLRRTRVLDVGLRAPRTLTAGQWAVVEVTVRNVSARRLASVTLRTVRKPAWYVTALTRTRVHDLAPGEVATARFRVMFPGRGPVSLPATATDDATLRVGWTAKPIRVTR